MHDYHAQLQQMREELMANAATTDAQAAIVELDQSKVGRLSRMDAMQAQAMAQAAVGRRSQQLRRIEAALQRLEDDEFGICIACDESINPLRLELDPTVLMCINCAAQGEQN
ncbi:MAG: molecular chaperone DnaK [Gammaproteobacteria bacterium]|nr:molecular chaperone DnaK [Gammaproteobacteria bacterium]